MGPSDLLAAITDATSDLVHAKDRQGRYLMVNRGLADVAGRPADELIGLSPQEVFGEQIGAALAANDQEVLRSGEPQLFDEVVVVGGRERTFSTSKSPLYDETGAVIGLVGISRDITDLRLLQEQLEAARAREVEDRFRRVLAEEHRAVALLQQAILPVLSDITATEVAGIYQPARGESQVGGDWYDVFELDDQRVALVVGDVAGHGIAAAGLMAQLRNGLRAHAFNDLTPADTFTALNRMMEMTQAADFATCLFALLEPKRRLLTWARAGHPPLVVHRDGLVVTPERLADPPLGAVPGHRFAQTTMELHPDDLLVLYTDGLVERREEPLDDGIARLTRAVGELADLEAGEICGRICHGLLGGEPSEDDLCLLVLRVP
jgi:PAS domain S-box-containing protein